MAEDAPFRSGPENDEVATGGSQQFRMRRAVVPVGDGVGRLAQGGRFAIGEWYGPFFVLDVHPGFGSVALNRQVLQLPAVGGFRNRQCTMLGKPSVLLFVLWGNAQARNIETASSSGQLAAGGWPRPSLRWQR